MRFLLVAAALVLAAPVHAQTGPSIAPGESWSMAMTEEGEFGYHCHPHPWMEGSIAVGPKDGEAENHLVAIVEPQDDTSRWSFEPAHIEVKQGDTVTWINNGENAHTVMFNGDMGAHEDHGHDHDDPGHDHGDHNHADSAAPQGAPGFPLGLALVALALFVRR